MSRANPAPKPETVVPAHHKLVDTAIAHLMPGEAMPTHESPQLGTTTRRATLAVKPAPGLPSRRRSGVSGNGQAVIANQGRNTAPETPQRSSTRHGHPSIDNHSSDADRVEPTKSAEGNGRNAADDQHAVADFSAPVNTSGGHTAHVSQSRPAAGKGVRRNGHRQSEDHAGSADLRTLESLIAHYGRSLWDRQATRIREGNRIAALERDGLGDWTETPVEMLDGLKAAEHAVDVQLTRLVRQHPLSAFVDQVDGLGYPGLGRLLAATGSFDNFANPAKLWAYLGMHVRDGKAPKRAKGTRANWSQQGRVVCRQIGEAIVKVGKGKYRELYDRKRSEYLARERLGASGCPFGHEHVGEEREHDVAKDWQRKTGAKRVVQCVKTDAEGKETSAHVHAAAMRYAVKKLLLGLWVEWWKVRPKNDPAKMGMHTAAQLPGQEPRDGQEPLAIVGQAPNAARGSKKGTIAKDGPAIDRLQTGRALPGQELREGHYALANNGQGNTAPRGSNTVRLKDGPAIEHTQTKKALPGRASRRGQARSASDGHTAIAPRDSSL